VTARVAAALAILGAILLGVTAASAQSNPSLIVRRIDAVDPKNVKVDFIYTGAAGDVAGTKISQNGADVALSGAPAQIKGGIGVVLVIDSGPNMDADNSLAQSREGAKKIVDANTGGGIRFAVVQAGDKGGRLVQDFTSDASALKKAIDGIGPTPGAAVWSALNIAGSALQQRNDLQPNIVLFVGDNDNVKPADEPLGRTAVISAGAQLFAVERGGVFDPGPYDALVSRTGGQVLVADAPPKMADLGDQAGKTISTQQFTATYNANVDVGTAIDVNLTVGGQTVNANVLANGVYQGGPQLHPELEGGKGGSLPVFDNSLVFAVALALTLLAAVGAAYALTSIFVKEDLSDMLMPYAEGYGGNELEEGDASYVGKSALMQRAVALTEQVAENQGLLTRAEGALERANLPLRAGEALFFYVGIVVAVTLLGLIWQRNLIAGLILGVLGAILPVMIVNTIAKRRRKKFMGQLPDTLSLLSGTLRAGYSLMQGVEAVSQEVDEPMGLELRRVITESRLGRPLEESLEASADRMDSPDFAWAVMAIGIQREVGGNLAELLMTVADTMVHRERLRRDVASLTAEGRISAYVLAGLPPGLGMIMYVLNPEYVSVLWSDGLGIGMVITATISMLIGFFWMKKIITIEI
jgi:tight adherence protein B